MLRPCVAEDSLMSVQVCSGQVRTQRCDGSTLVSVMLTAMSGSWTDDPTRHNTVSSQPSIADSSLRLKK